MSGARVGAGEVARGLAGRIDQLVAQLLPGGRREGHEWRVGSLAGEPGQSCAVHLSGARAGVWSDFASGERGDALDLVAAVLFGGDKSAAFQWGMNWLGWEQGTPPEERRRQAPAQDDAAAEQARERRKKSGLSMWLAARELPGSPAAAYLAGRGLDLEPLGKKAPGALRYHPDCYCDEVRGGMPAMVSQVNRAGVAVAVHRTYLALDTAGVWRKAPLRAPKKVLGSFGGGYIPLWRGRSGLPVAAHPETDTLALTEGIEDGLTVALHRPDWRVLAAVSVANFAAVTLPGGARDVVLVLDRDGENPAVRKARQAAIAALTGQGRQVRVVQPPEGFKDFNEWHQAVRREGVAA